MPKLILQKNSDTIQEFELTGPKPIYLIGSSSSNDLVIPDDKVAPRHLRVEKHNGCYYLETLESFAGTHLNGRPLVKRAQMVDGDDISIGDHTLLFENIVSNTIMVNIQDDNEIEILGEEDIPAPVDSLEEKTGGMAETASILNPTGTAASDPDELFEVEEFPDETLTEELTAGALTPQFPPAKTFSLLAIHGPYIGKTFSLNDGDTRIGRDLTLNDIVIRNNAKGELDPSVSRRHATISKKNGNYYITDKRSKTRTYVNQRKMDPADEILVCERDEIEIVSDQQSTIFRVVADDTLDAAPPRKAGVWWIRNKLRLGIILSSLCAVGLFATLGLSYKARLAVSKKPGELKLYEETWFQNKTAAAYDLEQAAVAIADLTGDNKVDLVFANPRGQLTALNGVTKETIWFKDQLKVRNDLAIVLADLNLNDINDVLVVGQDARLYAFDGLTGAEIWLSPILSGEISGPPVVGDFDDDGLQDLLLCSRDGEIHLAYGNIFEPQWKTVQTTLTFDAAPSTFDLDNDGIKEIFIGAEEGRFVVLNGKTGMIARTVDLAADLPQDAEQTQGPPKIQYPIMFGNLNGNPGRDLLLATSTGHYLTLDGATFEPIWHETLPFDQDLNNHRLAPALGKFNGDDLDDAILLSSQTIEVIGSSADSGKVQVLWEYELETEDYFVTPLALADVNKDNLSDVVIGTQEGAVLILDGKNGQVISQVYDDGNPVISPILVADVGADGYLDLLFIRKNGNISKIQSNSPLLRNKLIWSQLYGDEMHTGRYSVKASSFAQFDVATATFGALFLFFGLLTYRGYSNLRKHFQPF